MDIILKKYDIQREINSGAFGKIFFAKNKSNEDNVAIKIEEKENSLLRNEANIYKYLDKNNNIPSLRMYLSDEKYNYLVIDLLGISLKEFKNNYLESNKNLDTKIICNIANQMINIIEFVHNKGIVHRDIKPDNFMFDENKKKLYLIDFGFAKKIINKISFRKKETHISERKINNIIGSPNYISINVHKLNEPSRRDDLESIIYIIFYLFLDEIPWVYESLDIKFEQKKKLIENINKTSEQSILIKLISYCNELSFDEKPDYKYIRNEIIKII